MAFKCYIDDQLTDQPFNDMDLVTTLKRDSDMGGFLITQDVALTWYGNNAPAAGEISAFSYLKTVHDSGTCNEVRIKLVDEVGNQTNNIYLGVIKMPAITITEDTARIDTKIDDNNFYSYIKNNASIKWNLYSTVTKNGEPITPPQIYQVDMFNSTGGVYLSTIGEYFYGYRLYDVLKYIIPMMSDNKITFESDFLREMTGAPLTPTDPIELMLFDGFALVNPGAQPALEVSFEECIQEIFKLKNTSFFIDLRDPENPVFRLEQQSWFFGGLNSLSFTDIDSVKTTTKVNKIYGTIKVGADYNPSGLVSAGYTWNAGTSYFGWKEEIYTPYGQCNTDIELNLVNSWLIASNAVNDQVVGVVTANLDKTFCVECDNLDTALFTAIAVDYQPFGTSYKYYNYGLNNVKKIQTHGGNFQSAVTNTLAAGTDRFRASLGADTLILDQTPSSGLQSTFDNPPTPATVDPLGFADEFGGGNYDPGGNYDNVLFHYTAPAPGDYSFSSVIHGEVQNLKSCLNATLSQSGTVLFVNVEAHWGLRLTVLIESYEDNTLANLINTDQQVFFIQQNGTFNYPVSSSINLPSQAVVRVKTQTQLIRYVPSEFGNSPVPTMQGYTITASGFCFAYASSEPKIRMIALEDSIFECNGTPDGALIIAAPDPELYKVRQHEFKYHISASDWQTLIATPLGSFEFQILGNTRYGWIEQIQYNNWTGQTTIKLITSDAAT